MRTRTRLTLLLAGAMTAGSLALGGTAFAHGDVTPQAVDTTGLPDLGEEWVEANPFRGNARAIEIGASAYNQNCARCHGLGAISGGIAPDLRYLEPGDSGDEWYVERVKNGAVRDGKVYMPKFGDTLGQEALWAIRAWLETVPAD
ncbi:cytochrome c-550 PedF [Indioceanicola profundi]|uniref:cytochrome c-550 PedF n=1 Tax=Indioceanicola profundi TaxID=2220096 RepID=UPI000E6AA291|nr:cytochrome c-550 PedF [Indioceanicola profundi]